MSRLVQILEAKADEVAFRRAQLPQSVLADLGSHYQPRGFRRALLDSAHSVALIAEVKKASPSQGLIRANFDPVSLAEAYVRAGADALSVLTDEPFFQGSPADLQAVRKAVGIPMLRKDFTIDSYQLYEARAWGADCVLLIVAALDSGLLRDLHDEAKGLGLDVLVETHSANELEVALGIGADLVGVNNRNLATFVTDLGFAEALLPTLPPVCLGVAESAISSSDDVTRMRRAGARAVLIGTEFARSEDPEERVRQVMGW